MSDPGYTIYEWEKIMSKQLKLCWWCKNFYYSQATPDYSELTPGSSFGIECMKRHWDFDAYTTTQEKFGEMLASAESCKDFAPIAGGGL